MTDFEKERTAAEKLAEANHTVPGPAAVSGNITSADSETSSGEEGTPAPANPADRTDASVEQAASQTEEGACVPATACPLWITCANCAAASATALPQLLWASVSACFSLNLFSTC